MDSSESELGILDLIQVSFMLQDLINLKDLHGNSAVPVILLYLFCGCCNQHTTSCFHAYWSFTWKPIILVDDLGSYPNNGAKLKQLIIMMVAIIINKIGIFLMFLFE